MEEHTNHASATHAHHGGAHKGHEAHAGHDKHAGHSVAMFRDKFWIVAAPDAADARLGAHAPERARVSRAALPGSAWIPALFGTAVFVYGGWPFLQGAWRELSDRLPGMMTLISLAITVAFVFSAAVTLGYPGHAALGGAGDARHHHASRSLDRDALDLAGDGRAGRAGEAAAEHCDSHRAGTGTRPSERRRCRSATSARAISCSCDRERACRRTASCARARAP